jgi:hypothetical protein
LKHDILAIMLKLEISYYRSYNNLLKDLFKFLLKDCIFFEDYIILAMVKLKLRFHNSSSFALIYFLNNVNGKVTQCN